MLASQLIRGQGIEVLALFFETPFFSSAKPRKSAESIKLPLKVIDITEKHLEVVRSPKHGYGGNMNPCVDCHALMLRQAGEMLEEEGASFIISGEVLGQRPMSQNKKALAVVASESGFEGLILRPLSAKRLSVTIPEEKGWVNRDQLMDFAGRSRKPQMELARRLKIKEYPSPAGGCLLTDKEFSRRLKDLFSSSPEAEVREIELLKLGRHFRIDTGLRLVVGRNKAENQAIQSLSNENDTLLKPTSVPGPTVLVLGDLPPDFEELAASVAASYSDAEDNIPTKVRLSRKGVNRELNVRGPDKDKLRRYMI
jgi:tRNA U34 2-thiouridine synthase MnmA/TrmU